jgi:hypothetical protein
VLRDQRRQLPEQRRSRWHRASAARRAERHDGGRRHTIEEGVRG